LTGKTDGANESPATAASNAGRPADAFTDRIGYSLVVLTTKAPDGERSGCLVGFTTQCSIEPPRFAVCISKANHTAGVLSRCSALGLHLLGYDQADAASLFGEETGDLTDKFSRVTWHHGPEGVPVLDECAAWLVTTIAERIDVGDHVVLVTDPVAGGPGTHEGLLTNRNAPTLEPGHPVD